MPDPTPDAIREAFEREFRKTLHHASFTRRADGGYYVPDVEMRWTGWQAALAAATTPRPAPEGTVMVRVPVVMDATGQYFAIRHSADSDRQAMSKCLEYAADDLGEIRHATWIVADVPSPPVEVRGEVEA